MGEMIFDGGSLPALEAILRFTAARHKAIASNIANADTPGYRAVDLPAGEFRRALDQALAGHRAELRLRPEESSDAVTLETELAKMVKNGTLHNLAATLLAQQFHLLREAVGERVIA